MSLDQSVNPNTNNFWKYIKSLKKSKKSIPDLQFNDVTYSSDFAKANALNKFFSSCFNQFVPPSTPECKGQFSTSPDKCPKEYLCTDEEVYDFLLSLNVDKSSGLDNTMISAHNYIKVYALSMLFPSVICQTIFKPYASLAN